MDHKSISAHIRALNVIVGCLSLLNIGFIFTISLMWHRAPQDVDISAANWSLAVLETVLAVLALVLALGAFAGFWLVRHAAIDASREEARKRVDEELPRLFEEYRRTEDGGPNRTEPMVPTDIDTDAILDAAEEATGE